MSRIHIFWGWAECSVMDIVMMRHRLAFVKGWLVSRERKGGPETHILDHPILHSAKKQLRISSQLAWNSRPKFWPEIPGKYSVLKILSYEILFRLTDESTFHILKRLGIFQRGKNFSRLLKLGMTRDKFWTENLFIFGICFQFTKYNFSP